MAPVNVEQLWSNEARRLQNASLSGLVGQFAGIPVVALHVGLPPPASFPVSAIHLDLVPHLTHNTAANSTAGTAAGNAQPHPQEASCTGRVSITAPDEVSAAQQYIFSHGYAPLMQWVDNTMQREHAPPVPVQSAITSGAVHAIGLATCMLCNPGDWVLVDEFTYSHVLETVFIPKGVRPLPVRMDASGMDPQHLRQQLQWAASQLSCQSGRYDASVASADGGDQQPAQPGPSWMDTLPPPTRPPQLLYLIPTGHNPTGITMPLQRKQELYEVARDFGLIILEDDAYYWLHWGDEPPSTSTAAAPSSSSGGGGGGGGKEEEEVAAPTPPCSFLAMDVDRRVVRVDTLAKVLGPGYRIGWVTGHPDLVAKIALAAQASCVGPCPLAQVCVWSLLQQWGPQGWAAHLSHLRRMYQRKARALERAVATHLAGTVRWRGVPGAGMFMWLELLGGDQEHAAPPTGEQLAAALKEARVVVVPGAMSWADMHAVKAGKPCPFMRLTFAFLEEQQLEEGAQRLARALQIAQQ